MFIIKAIWFLVRGFLGSRLRLALENLALRQQLAAFQRSTPRPRLQWHDRVFWVWLARCWPSWKSVLTIVQPETVIR
jgi:hypothetical protein